MKHKIPGYHSWSGMLRRCNDPNFISYKYYGAKGITVCERWSCFDNFLADMGVRPEGTSLDRIDSLTGYYPANCRWVGIRQQNNNRSFCIRVQYKGKVRTLKQWAKHLGINYNSLYYRHTVRKMQVPEIFEQPIGRIYL